MTELNELSQLCLGNLLNCTDNALKYLKGNEKDQQIQLLKESLLEYCNLDYQQQIAKEAINKAKDDIDIENIESLSEKFTQNMQSLIRSRPPHHAFRNFESKLLQNNDPGLDDSDIITTEVTQNFIDPFTKKQITSPVKNKICGHVYEASSVKIVLARQPNTKCPVGGCGNRKPIHKNDLLNDEEFKRQIMLSQNS